MPLTGTGAAPPACSSLPCQAAPLGSGDGLRELLSVPEALLTCLPARWARQSHLLPGLSQNCLKGSPCFLGLGPPCFRGHSLS